MNTQLFEELLQKQESSVLDFKEEHYFKENDQTHNKRKRNSFIKDILSFANTVRNESAYIIIGVKQVDGKNTLSEREVIHIDEAILQEYIKGFVDTPPKFIVHSLNYNGKGIEIIEIPLPEHNIIYSPFKNSTKDPDGGSPSIYKNDVYYRAGSSNTKASPVETERIRKWLSELHEKKNETHAIYSGFLRLNDKYWEGAKSVESISFLTNLNSNTDVISSAIVNNLTSEMSTSFTDGDYNDLLEQLSNSGSIPASTLIEIIGPSGMGKSTLLLKLAYKYREVCQCFLITSSLGLDAICEYRDKPALILLDDAAQYDIDEIMHFIYSLPKRFSKGFLVIVAEQTELWRNHIGDVDRKRLYKAFHHHYLLSVSLTKTSLMKIWTLLLKYIASSNSNAKVVFYDNKKQFINVYPGQTYSLADRLITLMLQLGKAEILKEMRITPDWERWDVLLRENENPELTNLFGDVAFATLYNAEFPIGVLSTQSQQILTKLLTSSSQSYPMLIYEVNGDLFVRLRHKKIADWYFKTNYLKEGIHKARFYSLYFKDISIPAKVKLFRSIHQDRNFDSISTISYNDRARIFEDYIANNKEAPNDIQVAKCTFELIKIYYSKLNEQKRAHEMLDSLPSSKFKHPLKISYLIQEEKFEEAQQYLSGLLPEELKEPHLRLKIRALLRNEAVYTYGSSSISEVIKAFERGILSAEGVIGLALNYYNENTHDIVWKLLSFLYEKNDSALLSNGRLRRIYLSYLVKRNRHAQVVEIFQSLSDDFDDYYTLQIVSKSYYALKRYSEAITLCRKIFEHNPLLSRNLKTILDLINQAGYSFSVEELNEYLKCIDLTIKHQRKDLDILDEKKKKVLSNLYRGYIRINYRLGRQEGIETIEAKLLDALKIFPGNDYVRLDLIDYYLNVSPNNFIKNQPKIQNHLEACQNKESIEYLKQKATYLEYLNTPSSLNELFELISGLKRSHVHSKVAYGIELSMSYRRGDYLKVINTISSVFFARRDYYNYEINNLFYYSIFRLSYGGDKWFQKNLEIHNRNISSLMKNNDYQGNRYFTFCKAIVNREFEEDKSYFEQIKKQIEASVLNDARLNMKFIRETIEFLIHTNHLKTVMDLLETLRHGLGNKFSNNADLEFVLFSCQIANWDRYFINMKGTKIKNITPPSVPENYYDIDLVEKMIIAFMKAGIKRRLFIYLYLLWKYCNYEQKAYFMNKMISCIKMFNKFSVSHAIGKVENVGNGMFVIETGQYSFKFKDENLDKRTKEGQLLNNNYASINIKTRKVFNVERAFVVDGFKSKKNTVRLFHQWIAKLNIPEIEKVTNRVSQYSRNGEYKIH